MLETIVTIDVEVRTRYCGGTGYAPLCGWLSHWGGGYCPGLFGSLDIGGEEEG